MFKGFLRFTAVFWLALLLLAPLRPALALNLIRDAEIESSLRSMATPIFTAAGLTPEAVHIFIINDPAINAFVAGGSNIFLNTGLILATENAAMLIGAVAHETGHIAGGHLAQGTEKLRNARLGSIIGYVLGAAAGVGGGGGKATAAVFSATQQAAQRNLLSFTRANEQAADQAALGYLDENTISASGLLRLFEVLRRHETRQFGTPDPYTRTHPLSAERISHVRNHVEMSKIPEGHVSANDNSMYQRIVAKLFGFMQPLEQTLAKYPQSDQSIAARYARAVAWYKVPELEKSLREIDSLIKEKPSDPYFHELKGQILFENGKIREAISSYSKAVALKPDAPLIRADYAKALLAAETPDALQEALRQLERSTSEDAGNAPAWHLLATAYGKQGNLGLSNLALAEESLLRGNAEKTLTYVAEAEKTLPANGASGMRAQDLKIYAEKLKKDQEERER